MKIALITDTHWGVRGDSVFFLNQNKKFLDNVFFPTLQEQNIDHLIHLGDVFDRRKYVNVYTASRIKSDFFDKLVANNIKTHIICGNHDTYFKNTNKINSLSTILPDYNTHCIFYIDPEEIEIDGLPILFLPWICDDNRQQTVDLIRSTKAQIAMGHLSIEKFPMYKGMPAEHGDSAVMFNKFDMVLSGHYHTRSHAYNIWYLGAHAEFTWSDYNDPRGFHIFDTSTRELTFIENPYKVFRKIFYNDSKELPKLEDIDNSIIKVVIQNKEDTHSFDKFISSIEKKNPVELQIVEDHLNLHLEDEHDIIDEAESTIDIFKKYIEKLELQNSLKEPLEKLIIELYTEALSVEETWQ